MTEESFPLLPARKRLRALSAGGMLVLAAGAVVFALNGGWGWWIAALALAIWAVLRAAAIFRMPVVARVDATGVTTWLPTGRKMAAKWGEIQGHTIDPARRLGGIVVGAGPTGRVRVLPVATADMGPEAAARLIAAMKERLPKLEYRVPSLRRG